MPVVEVELDLGDRAPPPQAARGLDAAVLEAHAPILAAAGPPGNFLLHASAPYATGRAAGLRALARQWRLDEEVEEVLCGPHRAKDQTTITQEDPKGFTWHKY